MSGGGELGGHLLVHGDHHLLLGAHDRVSLLDLVVDPRSELVAQDHGADIDQPLLWDLRQVDVVREEVANVRLVTDEREDAVNGQVLVLRDEQGLDLLVGDVRFSPGKDILQEVYGHVICTKKAVRQGIFRNLPYGGR